MSLAKAEEMSLRSRHRGPGARRLEDGAWDRMGLAGNSPVDEILLIAGAPVLAAFRLCTVSSHHRALILS